MIYIIGGRDRRFNFQLIRKAREMEEHKADGKVKLFLWSGREEDDPKKYEADEIIILKNSTGRMYYDYEAFARIMIRMAEEDRADLLLFPSDPQCRELAALLAARMDRAFMADCTDIRIQDSDYLGTRPSLDGTHFSTCRFEGEKPYLSVMKSVEAMPFQGGKPAGNIRIMDAEGDIPRDVRLLRAERRENIKKDIRDAEIIFAGGRGMLNEESFLELRKLAGLYHASVGGSRPVVDAGWAAADEQVGQTGSFVRPKVYLAFGISGAVQHIAGMKESRYIIAVNTRKDSPIFRYCDYGIYADANSVIRNMIHLLSRTEDR